MSIYLLTTVAADLTNSRLPVSSTVQTRIRSKVRPLNIITIKKIIGNIIIRMPSWVQEISLENSCHKLNIASLCMSARIKISLKSKVEQVLFTSNNLFFSFLLNNSFIVSLLLCMHEIYYSQSARDCITRVRVHEIYQSIMRDLLELESSQFQKVLQTNIFSFFVQINLFVLVVCTLPASLDINADCIPLQ